MILQQPAHSIRFPAFLISRQRKNDVAVRNKPFALESNETLDHGCIGLLHILRAAAIEVPILLDQLKWIGRPIGSLRFNHVDVPNDQDRSKRRAGAPAIPCNHIALALVGPKHDDIGSRKASLQQPFSHSLCGNCGAPHRVGRINLDKLLKNVVGERSIGFWQNVRLRRKCRNKKHREQKRCNRSHGSVLDSGDCGWRRLL